MSWYGASYRKLFFDFHSPSTTLGLAKDFNADTWSMRLKDANAQAVSVFVKCGFGWSFYRKGSIRYVHPELPQDLDMLESQIAALHRDGLKAIGYYHTFNSEPMSSEYPDWCRRDEHGNKRGISMCLQGPLLQTWMLPHLEEILTNYDLDAVFFDGLYATDVCYCSHCRQRFRDEIGLELPMSQTDTTYSDYVKWVIADFRRIREEVCQTIHQVRPDLPVSVNWAYTMRQPEPVPNSIGSLMLDIFPDVQLFNASYEARHWAPTNVPFDIMNSAFLQWWGDWTCKPAAAMQHELATVIANGGLTWIGYQMTHTFDVPQPIMNELGKALSFVKERESLLVDAKPKAFAAILHSPTSHFTPEPRIFAEQTRYRGAHKLFMESSIPHHFVDEAWLIAHIRNTPVAHRYNVIVLPDLPYVSSELVECLQQFVHEGGMLVATGTTGTVDKNLEPMKSIELKSLLGVDIVAKNPIGPHCYIDVSETLSDVTLGIPHLIDESAVPVQIIADDVEVLAHIQPMYQRSDGASLLRWSPPSGIAASPAITRRSVGLGHAIYIAVDIFKAYHTKNLWPVKQLLATVLRRTAQFPLEISTPAWLEVCLSEQSLHGVTRSVIHLVNHHGNRAVDGNNLCIEQTLPVRDIILTIRQPNPPVKVTLEPCGTDVHWQYENGRLTVAVPEVNIHAAVVIEDGQ